MTAGRGQEVKGIFLKNIFVFIAYLFADGNSSAEEGETNKTGERRVNYRNQTLASAVR